MFGQLSEVRRLRVANRTLGQALIETNDEMDALRCENRKLRAELAKPIRSTQAVHKAREDRKAAVIADLQRSVGAR